MEIKTIQTDVLIIGSGGAGSRAAIEVDDAQQLYQKAFHSGPDVQEWRKGDTMQCSRPLTKTTP